jgi:uncharacterized protein (TIGR03435 family)
VSAQAGAPARFEVASIRPTGNDYPYSGFDEFMLALEERQGRVWRGRMLRPDTPLIWFIQRAYGVWSSQIQGGPDWIKSTRYTVDARLNGDATVEQLRPMLRALLAERFKLAIHREMRTLPVFELRPVRGGHKLVAFKEGDCIPRDPRNIPPPPPAGAPRPRICGGPGSTVTRSAAPGVRFEAFGVSMEHPLNVLSGELDRIVVDRTGLTEKFNLRLEYEPIRPIMGMPGTAPGTPQSRMPSLRRRRSTPSRNNSAWNSCSRRSLSRSS